MDANGQAKSSGEISMMESKKATNEVILTVSGEDKYLKTGFPNDSKDQNLKVATDAPDSVSISSPRGSQKTVPMSYPSPGNVKYSPNDNKPPKIPTTKTLTRRKSSASSVYCKSKSRFGEQSIQIDGDMFDENGLPRQEQNSVGSPNTKVGSGETNTTPKETIRRAITPRTPLIASPGFAGGVDEDEAIYKKVNDRKKLRYKKVKVKVLMEWLVFLCILGFLIVSLAAEKVQDWTVWGLEIWKWCVMVMVTFSGMLFTRWFIHFVVLLIELNFLLRKKVLYFVHGLKKSTQIFLWLSLILITWILVFKGGVRRSRLATQILDYITWTIVTLLIGSLLWLLKNLLLKMLASSFHVNTFFDRIQESVFHQYIVLTLSGPPVMESNQMLGRTNSTTSQLSFRRTKKGKGGKEKEVEEVIDISKLHEMKRDKVSAWTLKMLVDVISNSGLSTISGRLDESIYDEGNEQRDKEITNEEEAIAAAYHVFRNVARPGCKYIDEYDLGRFMIKEEVDIVFSMIDVAETRQIDRKALTDWLVKVYKGRKALAHALNDTKTAIKQLNKLVTAILMIINVIVWLLLMEIATTKVLVFISSQLVLAAFMFGNTCKTIFEAIIFVFVMHPFDVGDRCVIDGVTMIVEEMNILTTVFLKFDNEKIYYPNSVLATKPISNYYRSPDMGDALEFSIDFRTSMEKIGALKEKIKKYLEKNPQHWHPNHNVVVKEIENVNKIKMALFFNHTMNFQDLAEKNRRRTELVLEMKKIFEELGIKYDLLPQEVHLVESKRTTETLR